ncbi:APC family permease [Streptomyces sp. XD-27]|uniref:APC family permease n=1 Tax=Streptomyces sp. XD-27 TaxID=3062779 RepID=UPI0026F4337C|nr:APC family permease [Streptomyces sp. XD-27]WKX72356.1 APC family permease [Streptomyces sp. XD-27]
MAVRRGDGAGGDDRADSGRGGASDRGGGVGGERAGGSGRRDGVGGERSGGSGRRGGAGGDRSGGGGLRRTLTFRDLVVYGLLFIAPMAPVGVFGTLDATSRGAVALVYVVATAAMALTAFSYAQMVRVAPQAGSVFTYAQLGLGEGAGFVAGWMALLDYLLIPAVAYLFSGIAMEALVPEVDRWVWTAVAVVVTTGLNLWGVRAAARVGFLVLAMEIAVLVVFVAVALERLAVHGARRDWVSPFTAQGSFSMGAVLTAVSVAVLSYLGFDAIASFAEEAEDAEDERKGRAALRAPEGHAALPAPEGRAALPAPGGGGRRAGSSAQVARAVLTCLVVAGVLFVAQTYLAALLSPVPAAELARDPARQGSAFYDMVAAAVGDWLRDLVAVSKAIGAAFAALAGQAAAARLVFAMSRDRRLPATLAKVDAHSGVPRRALLGSGALTLVAAVWAARRDDGLDRLVSVVDIGALTAFTLLHASVIGWFWIRGHTDARHTDARHADARHADARHADARHTVRHPLRHLVVPLLGMGISVAVIARAAGVAQVAGLVWCAMGLAVLLAQRELSTRAAR